MTARLPTGSIASIKHTTEPLEGRLDTMKTLNKTVTISTCKQGTYTKYLVPFLRLRGKWLEAAGFKEGARCAVTVNGNTITITTMR